MKTFDIDELQDELGKLDELEQEAYEKRKKWRATMNKEGAAKRSREYYPKYKEVCIARAIKWHKEHPEESKKVRKRSYDKNRESLIAKAQDWRKKNSEKAREHSRKYREKKKLKQQQELLTPKTE